MKPYNNGWVLAICCVAAQSLVPAVDADPVESTATSRVRETRSFDADWRFHLGEATDAERRDFDDSRWQQLNVPHDWSIAGPFDRDHLTGGAGAFLPAGVGWYRKRFSLSDSAADKVVAIEFDGVMANSDVWINGHLLGRRPSGYVSFRHELTEFLEFGEGYSNVLAVRVDNSKQPASRWYTGAGIYRHVRLVMTNRLHIAPCGVFVTASEIGENQATVVVATHVRNGSSSARDVALVTELINPEGTLATSDISKATIQPGESHKFQQNLTVRRPQLWDVDQPQRYAAVSRLQNEGNLADEIETPFGIRDAEFRSDSGFWLNGRNLKIKGVCLHHDGEAFGAAVPNGVWERRLKRLRGLGVNAIRTAHNPPSPELLELCDRLGLMVMEEFFDCWTKGKVPYDYHSFFEDWAMTDLSDTICRDRNHPCIILYSVGNEIRDTNDPGLSKAILRKLIDVCHRTDPTRPVTQGLFRPNRSGDYDNGLADMLDVVGTNYRDRELLEAWSDVPTRKIIGTEQGHEGRVWLACRDNPQHAGQFLWVGVDYLGESPRWPITTFYAGLLDRTGRPYPRAFERQSWWTDEPMVAIFRRIRETEATPNDPGYEETEWRRRTALVPDWTPADTGPHNEVVEVYSNCESVELLLNDVSLGDQPLPSDGTARLWNVGFESGTLTAKASVDGHVVAIQELRTAGQPAKIVLATDMESLRPDWNNVAFVEAEVVDADGVVVPDARPVVSFSFSGPGEIIAIDNGSITSHEPFGSSHRRASNGYCIAIVRATGSSGIIEIEATSAGLALGKCRIAVCPDIHPRQ